MNVLKDALRKQIPNFDAQLKKAREESAIGRKVFALRKERGLTQKELAVLVGTTFTAISRIENADYEGHSVSLLKRIAQALNATLEVSFKDSSSADMVTATQSQIGSLRDFSMAKVTTVVVGNNESYLPSDAPRFAFESCVAYTKTITASESSSDPDPLIATSIRTKGKLRKLSSCAA